MTEAAIRRLSRKAFRLETNLIPYLVEGASLLPRFLGLDAAAAAPPFPSQAWIASTVASALGSGTEGLSRITREEGGYFLRDLLEAAPAEFLGAEHASAWGTSPAFLLKLLNSRDRLLVQVHPNGEKARSLFGSPFGKTEAWYVLDAEEGALAYAGFRPGVSRDVLREAILGEDSAAILGLLHAFAIRPGELLFIPAGLPHALGKGSLVAEIQEPCDITLRAERRRPSGELLPESFLHAGRGMETLLDCFDYRSEPLEATRARVFVEPEPIGSEEGIEEEALIPPSLSSAFSMNRLSVAAGKSCRRDNGAFTVALVTGGEGRLKGPGFDLELHRGTELFVPQGARRYVWEAGEGLGILECRPPRPEASKEGKR